MWFNLPVPRRAIRGRAVWFMHGDTLVARSQNSRSLANRAYVAWLRAYYRGRAARAHSAEKLSPSLRRPGFPTINFTNGARKFIKSVVERSCTIFRRRDISPFHLAISSQSNDRSLEFAESLFTRARSCAAARINCMHTCMTVCVFFWQLTRFEE